MIRLLQSFLFGSRVCSGCRQWVVASDLCGHCHAKMSKFLSSRKKVPESRGIGSATVVSGLPG